jgi:uroporphyrin-III C-methyltransferase
VAVHLVGAGPGDPGLITVRGLALVRACDVLVYDRLVPPELVDEAPADAVRIARDSLGQDDVNALLVAYGAEGLDVVRLKGGDPFVFGRGGEEAIALADAGVPYEVVPGVSALAAVPASAGIPVTHRSLAAQVTAVAGQGADGAEPDYDALAAAPGTLVFFMSLARLARLADALIAAGKPPHTAAAVISHGTLPDEVTVVAPLSCIATAADGVTSPALVVVGDVVRLREQTERGCPPAPSLASSPMLSSV